MDAAAVEGGELRSQCRDRDLGQHFRGPTTLAVHHPHRPHMPVERQLAGARVKDLAVTSPACSEARKTQSGAIASARLLRSRSSRSAAAFGSFEVGTERVMRVSADGQMTLTVMPLDAFSIATMRASATIPNLAAP